MKRTSLLPSASSPEPPTADALLASLLAQPAGDSDGLTTWELTERLGVNKKTVLEKLKRLHRAGKLAMGTRYEPSLNGRVQPVPTYRLKG